MFAQYDYSLYESESIVKVTLSSYIENDMDFDIFLLKWLELYNNKKTFIFIFDTSDVGYIPLKYSLRMSIFIKNLKKQDFQYLQKSIILVNSNIVKYMLDFIFMIQPPVAPVYITNDIEEISDIINNRETSATCILPTQS
ncbi:hypothetical protein CL646_05720 [bacterium]|nr:hypothetical protein [bacterium]|tara:strand:+ start:610 stop:1029 length:420 start_codon:yes stop_codon:yes gene_type:complete